MFNFVIILNTAPFFILAEDEDQVLEVCQIYKEKVERVIKAENLEVQAFKATISLSKQETLLIPEVVSDSLLSGDEQDQLVEELSNSLDT